MIYFAPTPSGLHSMLGQMMWFKRHATRQQFDYRIIIDELVTSKRNIGFQVIFEKLVQFTDKCVLKADVPSNIRTLSLQQFHDLFTHQKTNKSEHFANCIELFSDVKIEAKSWGQNYWHDHHIQLQMARNGAIDSIFPFYFCGLEDLLKVNDSLTSKDDNEKPLAVVHMRLGDCLAIHREDFSQQFHHLFEKEYLTTNGFMTQKEFNSYRKGYFAARPRHSAERIGRFVKQERYIQALGLIPQVKQYRIVLVTDGFDHILRQLTNLLPGQDGSIYSALKDELHQKYINKLLRHCDEHICGETADSAYSTALFALKADIIISGPSLFIPALRCAVLGVKSIRNWIMLDDQTDLDKYHQLPCLVKQDFEEYCSAIEFSLRQE